MRNNQYIEKYGEKALQIYNKKSQKQSEARDDDQQDFDEQTLQRENQKKPQKVTKPNSHRSLAKNSKSKSKVSISQYEPGYTFQRPYTGQNILDKDKNNKKKLIISAMSTPKNNRHGRIGSVAQERVPNSSTKKKNQDIKISQKLNEALLKQKSTKSVVRQLLECLDIISEHECKISTWITQFKNIIYHIADQAILFRKKYKEELSKNKKIRKQNEELQIQLKAGLLSKKKKTNDSSIFQQNQKLKIKINKLESKIENYQKKQMTLIQTLAKFKNPSDFFPESMTVQKKQQKQQIGAKIKKNFNENMQFQDSSNSQQQDDSDEFIK